MKRLMQQTQAYRLIIKPAPLVLEQMTELQSLFAKAFDAKSDTGLLQICLAEGEATEYELPIMFGWLHRSISCLPPFTLRFNNFSGQLPHILYVRVQYNDTIALICEKLSLVNRSFEGHQFPTLRFPKRWMLPICDQLPSIYYEKGLQFLSRQELALSQTVSTVWLEVFNDASQTWKIHQCIGLQGIVKSDIPRFSCSGDLIGARETAV